MAYAPNTNDYYPYGMLMPAEADGALPAEQPYKWSGKEYLTIHGINLYDFGPRALFSPLGIFTQPDPECESYPGISPYTYCAGNPVNLVDPTGEDIIDLDIFGNIINYTYVDGTNVFRVLEDGQVVAEHETDKEMSRAFQCHKV